jgi:hypothetical protein
MSQLTDGNYPFRVDYGGAVMVKKMAVITGSDVAELTQRLAGASTQDLRAALARLRDSERAKRAMLALLRYRRKCESDDPAARPG